MKIGLGLLEIPAPIFWRMTLKELYATYMGKFGIFEDINMNEINDLKNLLHEFN